MKTFKKIDRLKNAAEAEFVEQRLSEQDVPHAILPHNGAANPGLFQQQTGWGIVMAEEENRAQVLQVLAAYRQSN